MGALAERARQRLVQRPELRALREAQASQEIRSTDAKLQAQYQSPAPDVEVLKSETEHWNRLRDDRRRGYRHYARQRWNDSFGKKWESASQRSDVKAELSEHGRRLARLDRLKFLVATERKGEERTKLTAKLAQLRELEEARHERAMQGLTAVPEGATVAAAPAASGAKP